MWVKTEALREQIICLIGLPADKVGDVRWIEHILERLRLTGEAGHKRGMDEMVYAVLAFDVHAFSETR